MHNPGETEFEMAEQLLVELENYYDVSDMDLEPIVPGHMLHAAVGNWRQSLPKNRLDPQSGRIRARLWDASKADRGEAQSVAYEFAELILQRYPSLQDEYTHESPLTAGQWYNSPPPADSRFRYGPISGQLRQLQNWIATGESRTLRKNNGRGVYYIMQEHDRRFSVWFSSKAKCEEVEQRQQAENAR